MLKKIGILIVASALPILIQAETVQPQQETQASDRISSGHKKDNRATFHVHKVKNGLTPLHEAVEHGDLERVRQLLASGANPNVATCIGYTPLMIAAEKGNVACVDLLIQAGANIHVQRNNGPDMIVTTLYNGHNKVVNRLIKAGADTIGILARLFLADTSEVHRLIERLIALCHRVKGIPYREESDNSPDDSWHGKTTLCANSFENAFTAATGNPSNKRVHKKALKFYNEYRELLGFSPVRLFEEIDIQWYNVAEYHRIHVLLINDLSISEFYKKNRNYLALLSILDATPQKSEAREFLSNKVLEFYNKLRLSAHERPARSLNALDREWFRERVTKIHRYFRFDPYYDHADGAQARIIRFEQKRLGIDGVVLPAKTDLNCLYSGRAHAHLGQNFETSFHGLYLDSHPDLDNMLAVLYHEFGHIAHKDGEVKITPKRAEKLLQSPESLEDVKRIEHYIELGKQVRLSWQTETGKNICHALSRPFILWNDAALKGKKRIMAVYRRTAERRADLFALDNLFKHKKMGALMSMLEFFADKDYITAVGDWDAHPSAFERALYTIGFLIEKGIDVNAELLKWQHHGKCVDYKQVVKTMPEQSNKIRKTINKAYELSIPYELKMKDFLK